jgi:cell division initiation protein
MRMTVLDVQNHAFPRRWKGYDIDEVEQFRAALVEDWTALTGEAEDLRRRVIQLETRLEEMGTHERALRDALVTAQDISEELRRTAQKEAQMRVGAAEIQAEKILAAAHRQASRLAQDVRQLRALRTRMASSVRATIETHLALLEGFSRDGDQEMEGAEPGRLEALAAPPSEIDVRDLFGPPGPPPGAESESQPDRPARLATAGPEPARAAPEVERNAIALDAAQNEPSAIALDAAQNEPSAIALDAAQNEPSEAAPNPAEASAGNEATEPAAAPRPAMARPPKPPTQGWRVFFGQG